MNIKPLVFLGSGVSLPTFGDAGSVAKLTESLFKKPWVCGSGGEWRQDFASATDRTPPCQEFLRRLQKEVDDYYRKQRRSPSHYEDWFYLIEQMEDEMAWGENAALKPFTHSMKMMCADLDGPFQLATDHPFKSLLADTLVFIQAVISHELHTKKLPIGLGLLKELADLPGTEPLTVCTLNHDLLVEQFFKSEDILFADGFPEKHVNGVRYFSRTELQRSDVRAKLLKLHGSINWRRFRPTGNCLGDERIGIRTLPLDQCKTTEGKPLRPMEDIPHFLTGIYNKIASYQSGIYLALFREFDRALDEHDLIVMSGYGWGDTGINRRLKSWVWEKTTRQIVVMHKSRRKLRGFRSLLGQFEELRKAGKLITLSKWMCEVDAKQFCHRLERRVVSLSERSFVFKRSTSSKK